MSFNIPDYQRGYRWEKKHITQLLDDLLEFSDHVRKGFYCLQPLVVCKNKNLKTTNGNDVYDVIDGQQRLTTLFLILSIVRRDKGGAPFSLRYERECKGNSSDYNSGLLIFEDLIKESLWETTKDISPDEFFLTKAISDINKWIELKNEIITDSDDELKELILPKGFHIQNNYLSDDTVQDLNTDKKDVRFIWYDVSQNIVSGSTSSVDIFENLNYGKTSLTAGELIKALLFQCDIYNDIDKSLMKERCYRMSTEWDSMEKDLQDPFMWTMIGPSKYTKASHIDYLLDFVVKVHLAKEIDISFDDTDPYYCYFVVNEYFIEKTKQKYSRKDIVDHIWMKIQDVFATFSSWFKDVILYHHITLYLSLIKKYKPKENIIDIQQQLIKSFHNNVKTDFLKAINERISDEISISKLKDVSFNDLNYLEHSKYIEKILLAFNTYLAFNHKSDRQYLPFDFFTSPSTKPSLEHVHPQHLIIDDIQFCVLCEWYIDKRMTLKKEKESNQELNNAIENDQKLKEAFDALDPLLNSTDESNSDTRKKEYDNLLDAHKYLSLVDKYFDELADISEAELHSISNMALVDENTNAALGNKLMDAKRTKLKERQDNYDKIFNKTNVSKDEARGASYIFPGTWAVFNKSFSNEVKNLKFWTKSDREAYINQLKKAYNYFTNEEIH